MFSDRKAPKSDQKATKSGRKIRFSFFMIFFEFLNFETEKFKISPENSFRVVPETENFSEIRIFRSEVGKFFPGHHYRCGRQAAAMHLPGQASGRACPPLTLQLLSSAGLVR